MREESKAKLFVKTDARTFTFLAFTYSIAYATEARLEGKCGKKAKYFSTVKGADWQTLETGGSLEGEANE